MNKSLRIVLEDEDEDDRISQSLRLLHRKLENVFDKLKDLEILMTTNQEIVDAAIAGETSAVEALAKRVNDVQEKLATTITGLEATVAKYKEESIDVSGLETHLKELQDSLNAIDPATPVEETPAPVETPVEQPPAETPVETPPGETPTEAPAETPENSTEETPVTPPTSE